MMAVVAVLAVAWAMAAGVAATSNRGCDADCVCDGVDLSDLKGMSWGAEPATSGGDMYKLSVCEPIEPLDLPRGCRGPASGGRSLPRAVRWTGGDVGFNASDSTCEPLASDIVMAQQTATGVQLVYASSFNRTSHTIIVSLMCSQGAGLADPGLMTVQQLDGGGRVYQIKWHTAAACPPGPPPACSKECVCDGIDLGKLSGSEAFFTAVGEATHIAENGTTITEADGWEYYLSLCGPIEDVPNGCPDGARVLQAPRAGFGRSGCTAVGSELVTARYRHDALELIWQSQVEPGHNERTVTGRLICDRAVSVGQPGPINAVEGGDQNNYDWSFEWRTELACSAVSPQPPPPAPLPTRRASSEICITSDPVSQCVCDGVDLGGLRGHMLTLSDTQGNWQYLLATCGAVPVVDVALGLPASCQVLGSNVAALRWRPPTAQLPLGECEPVAADPNSVAAISHESGQGVELFFSAQAQSGECSGDDGWGAAFLQLSVRCDNTMDNEGSPTTLQPLMLNASAGSDANACQQYSTLRTRCISSNPDHTDQVGRLGWWLVPIALLFLCLFGAGLVLVVRRHRKLRSDGELSSSLRDDAESGEKWGAATADSAEFMR